jgi:hypothetical protein
MRAKAFKAAVKSVSHAKAKAKICGFQVRTGIRAGSTLQNLVSSIPGNLRSYS